MLSPMTGPGLLAALHILSIYLEYFCELSAPHRALNGESFAKTHLHGTCTCCRRGADRAGYAPA